MRRMLSGMSRTRANGLLRAEPAVCADAAPCRYARTADIAAVDARNVLRLIVDIDSLPKPIGFSRRAEHDEVERNRRQAPRAARLVDIGVDVRRQDRSLTDRLAERRLVLRDGIRLEDALGVGL